MNKKHERYLELAKLISTWSKDPRTKVGAVIVGEKSQIISQGFNGFPRGIKDDDRLQDRELKNKMSIHAEMNAIFNAAHSGASVENTTIYVSGLPCCHDCAKGIIQSGIKKVVMDTCPSKSHAPWDESAKLSLELFTEAKIDVIILDKSTRLNEENQSEFPSLLWI